MHDTSPSARTSRHAGRKPTRTATITARITPRSTSGVFAAVKIAPRGSSPDVATTSWTADFSTGRDGSDFTDKRWAVVVSNWATAGPAALAVSTVNRRDEISNTPYT